jgi:hypothetical protein
MNDHDLSPEQREELGDLRPLYNRLEEYDVPEPDSARLLAALKPLLAEPLEVEKIFVLESERRDFGDWLRLAWNQTNLLEAPFWWSSFLLTLLGALLGMSYGGTAAALCLVVVSPLVAVTGVAYLFRPATRILWELEQLSRVQPLEFLYARLALILTLNLLLAVALLLVAWTQGLQIVLWRLLLIWFGPMIGLTGIALFCSVRWNTLAGVIAPVVAWGLLVLAGWRETVLNTTPDLPNAPALITRLGMSNTLLLLAGVALVVGLLLLYESGRWVTRWR